MRFFNTYEKGDDGDGGDSEKALLAPIRQKGTDRKNPFKAVR